MVLMRLPFSGIAWLDNNTHPKGVGYGASALSEKGGALVLAMLSG
jgi:hypothetical protein